MIHGKAGQDFKHSKNLGQRIIKDTEDKSETEVSSLGDWKLSSSSERNRVEEGKGLFSIGLGYDKFEVMAGPPDQKSPKATITTKMKNKNKNKTGKKSF